MKKIYISLAILAISVSALLVACNRDKDGSARLRVVLHDMPVDFDSVKIEILEVRIHSNANGWTNLQTQGGIYDLLTLQNGVDTLLVHPQDVPSGLISQVRFILGSHNHVYIGANEFPLSLSSQDESGLKLNVHQELTENQLYTLSVDFDAHESIHQTGSETYKLKPVLSASFQQ